ncbi:MAG: glycosyltransferase [Planctomycetes bacterium]|nr:glycosyltransferase [Planctomycetota bacterium]
MPSRTCWDREVTVADRHFAVELSVVVPVCNEEDNLEELVERTVAAVEGLGRSWELLLVDDGSRDGSADRIEAAIRQHPGRVVGVFLNRNYGQHAAVFAGLEYARGAIVVTLDADLQNPPEEIGLIVAKMAEGYDVVGSVRVPRQDNLFRRLGSWLVNRMVRRATGVLMHDYGCMLRAYHRRIVDAILQCREQSTFIPVLANSFARRTAEVEVTHAPRTRGQSKYGFLKLVHLQFDLLTCMTTFPLRLLSLAGGLLSVAGVGLGVLLLVLRLVLGREWAAAGTFTLFAVLFLFVGLQFLAMGLLGEYLGRVYHDVRARPRYLVERVGGRGEPRPEGVAPEAVAAAGRGFAAGDRDAP